MSTREMLDPEAFEKAWPEGRAMDFEEAVAYARGDGVATSAGLRLGVISSSRDERDLQPSS